MQKDGFQYYRCPKCRLLFLSPLPTSDDLKKFYSADYFEASGKQDAYQSGYHDYLEYNKFKTSHYQFLFDELRNLGVRRVLDVGAAYGGFVDFLRKNNFDAMGIELSTFAAARAKELGNPVENIALELLGAQQEYQNKFDAATLLDVFEHLYDYPMALESLRAVIRPGGFILIVTPSSNSLSARILKKRWYHFLPPQHTHLFSDKNVGILLERYGFSVTRVEYIKKQFSLAYFLHILGGWVGLRIPRAIEDRLHGITFTFPLRDNMMIIAKKRA